MKNFWSILAAYLAAWLIFLLYDLTLSRRLARLREQLDRLKERVRQG